MILPCGSVLPWSAIRLDHGPFLVVINLGGVLELMASATAIITLHHLLPFFVFRHRHERGAVERRRPPTAGAAVHVAGVVVLVMRIIASRQREGRRRSILRVASHCAPSAFGLLRGGADYGPRAIRAVHADAGDAGRPVRRSARFQAGLVPLHVRPLFAHLRLRATRPRRRQRWRHDQLLIYGFIRVNVRLGWGSRAGWCAYRAVLVVLLLSWASLRHDGEATEAPP